MIIFMKTKAKYVIICSLCMAAKSDGGNYNTFDSLEEADLSDRLQQQFK